MKAKQLLVALLLISMDASAQDFTKIADVEKKRSGNSNDVLSGFYQLALRNLSTEENAIEFNSTLFALYKNYDYDKLQTKSRASIALLRNFQFNVKLNLTEEYKYNGISGGIKFAVLNKRDKEFIDLTNTEADFLHEEFSKLIEKANGIVDDPDDVINNVTAAVWEGTVPTEAKTKKLYYDYIRILDSLIVIPDGYFARNGKPFKKSNDVTATIAKLREEHYIKIAHAPLLTVSADGIANKDGKVDRGNGEVIFLWGGRVAELDARAKYTYLDTLQISRPRDEFSAKLGCNFKLATNKENKSYFEVKLYGEYHKIYRNVLPTEDAENFLANADVRLRITNDIWLPITLKYDTENANLLGFLNLTYSFGD
jgi:hypothetical protein